TPFPYTTLFRSIPMNLYYKNRSEKHPNLLLINISPNEGITLYLNAKETGSLNHAKPIKLSYNNDEEVNSINTPEAYQKLIYNCMIGDTKNFTHWEEVYYAWSFVDKITKGWDTEKKELSEYCAGSMGPQEAEDLLQKDGVHWWSLNGNPLN